jgi:LPXTG-motif cell wall-anchored protein
MRRVALSAIADGDHVILISQSNRVVSCGLIPLVETAPGVTPGMPRTGGETPMVVAAIGLGVLGLFALGAGLALRRRA